MDIAAMCSLARQMSISRGLGDPENDPNPADDHFDISKLTAISIIRMVSGIIVDPAHAQWSDEFRDTAKEHLDWVDSDLRASFNPNMNVSRTPAQEAGLNMTRELMGS